MLTIVFWLLNVHLNVEFWESDSAENQIPEETDPAECKTEQI